MLENPHLCTIATARYDTTSLCYEFSKTDINILNEVVEDSTMFTTFYEIDKGDNWTDEKNWKKSNSNLGISVWEDY